MYYQNVNQGYQNPGGFIPPSGYNVNSNYQAYGPNVMPGAMYNQNMNMNNGYEDDLSQRLDKIEKQIKSLDSRIQKLESLNNTDEVYMI